MRAPARFLTMIEAGNECRAMARDVKEHAELGRAAYGLGNDRRFKS